MFFFFFAFVHNISRKLQRVLAVLLSCLKERFGIVDSIECTMNLEKVVVEATAKAYVTVTTVSSSGRGEIIEEDPLTSRCERT
jgi:hypothetical protein